MRICSDQKMEVEEHNEESQQKENLTLGNGIMGNNSADEEIMDFQD